jgi:hypothetical protein
MADRYWTGGNGTWDTSDTTNWSTTPSGSGGASVPTAADSVFFQVAGGATITLSGSLTCLDLTVLIGTTFSGIGTLTISGSMSFNAGIVSWPSTGTVTFNATTTGKTVTTNGTTITGLITFDGVGGAWTLGSALSCGSVSFAGGTLNTAGYAVSSASFIATGFSVRTLTLGSSTWTITGSGAGAWDTLTGSTNLTVSAASSTINLTSSSAKQFRSSSGYTWGIVNQGGIGALTVIANGVTFGNITNTTQPATITFTAAHTMFFNAFSLSGTAGNLITINSTSAGNAATLSKLGGGIVSSNYLSIRDSTATGSGATWYAGADSTNVSNNTGWIFTNPPSGGMLFFFS